MASYVDVDAELLSVSLIKLDYNFRVKKLKTKVLFSKSCITCCSEYGAFIVCVEQAADAVMLSPASQILN